MLIVVIMVMPATIILYWYYNAVLPAVPVYVIADCYDDWCDY